MDKEKAIGNTWSVDTEGTKKLLEKARTQKTFKFYFLTILLHRAKIDKY